MSDAARQTISSITQNCLCVTVAELIEARASTSSATCPILLRCTQTVSGRATLDREAPLGYHADMTLPDLPAAPGAYVLLLTADAPVVLNMPRFGKLTLAAGQYAYVGSAHGPGGLRARVGRHLRVEKPLHWHIDYLTAAVPVVHVVTLAVTDGARLECTWAKRLLALNGASAPAPGFGSSDCRNRCPAHLVRLPDGLKPAEA